MTTDNLCESDEMSLKDRIIDRIFGGVLMMVFGLLFGLDRRPYSPAAFVAGFLTIVSTVLLFTMWEIGVVGLALAFIVGVRAGDQLLEWDDPMGP